eukprot:COSAG01_NODE_47448_length_390_cov_0.790378_1_plen_57_part_10
MIIVLIIAIMQVLDWAKRAVRKDAMSGSMMSSSSSSPRAVPRTNSLRSGGGERDTQA